MLSRAWKLDIFIFVNSCQYYAFTNCNTYRSVFKCKVEARACCMGLVTNARSSDLITSSLFSHCSHFQVIAGVSQLMDYVGVEFDADTYYLISRMLYR